MTNCDSLPWRKKCWNENGHFLHVRQPWYYLYVVQSLCWMDLLGSHGTHILSVKIVTAFSLDYCHKIQSWWVGSHRTLTPWDLASWIQGQTLAPWLMGSKTMLSPAANTLPFLGLRCESMHDMRILCCGAKLNQERQSRQAKEMGEVFCNDKSLKYLAQCWAFLVIINSVVAEPGSTT